LYKDRQNILLMCMSCDLTLRPTQTGMPMIMAGTVMPATRAIPTGAPTKVPNCHRIFFFRLQGFLPQKVHPDGLREKQVDDIRCDGGWE